MVAQIRFIHRRRDRLNRAEAAELRQLLLPVINDESRRPGVRLTARRLLGEVARETAGSTTWEFTMISVRQYADVVSHLRRVSARPAVAMELWAICMRELDFDTGEVMVSRSVLAAELGVSAKVVSELCGELVKCRALLRSFEDDEGHRTRSVRFFVNPRVGTRLYGEARVTAQAAAPVLLFPVSELPTERRSRAPVVASVVL